MPQPLNLAFAFSLCATAALAQTADPAQLPPAPGQIGVPASGTSPAAKFIAVTPQYNFSYGPDPQQPALPSAGVWNFYMPVQVNSGTPGWTTGEYGIGGLPDAFYDEPAYTVGGPVAGSCSWNTPYDSPPYWYYDGGASTNNTYEILSGTIMRASANIGSVYQAGTQQVPGSGVPVAGLGATLRWSPRIYPSAPFLISALFFATDSCYSGDVEYGFAHYDYYNPPVNQFYFYNYSNCAAPSGEPGSYACYLEANQTAPQAQCSAAVNLPTLPANSHGTDWYFWYAYIHHNPLPPSGNGHWVFTAGVRDPYTNEGVWSCVADPLGSPTFPTSTCPQLASVSYTCDNPYPTQQLHGALGSVTAGIANTSNTPPRGRVNPMLEMRQLYVTQP